MYLALLEWKKTWRAFECSEKFKQELGCEAKSKQQSLSPHWCYSNTKAWEGRHKKCPANRKQACVSLDRSGFTHKGHHQGLFLKERDLEAGHIQAAPVLLLWNMSCASQSLARPATWSLYLITLCHFHFYLWPERGCVENHDRGKQSSKHNYPPVAPLLEVESLDRMGEPCQSCSICTAFIPGIYCSAESCKFLNSF